MMKTTDKILIAIVLGVVVLIGAAFVVAFTQPEPEYRSGNDPEAIAYNYLLAMRQNDYERAYTYLSPTISGYPRSAEKFVEDINKHSYFFEPPNGNTSFEILSTSINGKQAKVTLRRTDFYQGDLFDSGESVSTVDMSLMQNPKNQQWQITHSDSHWLYCWNQYNGCR